MRRRVVEQPVPDVSWEDRMRVEAESAVASGRLTFTDAEYAAIETLLQFDSRRHLELTMCLMTSAQENSYNRHRLDSGDWVVSR